VTLPVFIDPAFIEPGFVTGVCGLLVGVICLLALQKHRIGAHRAHAEWSRRLERLELATQTVDSAPSVNARALAIGRREMRLIAEVSRLLTPK
jgi:hypothetical protein